LTATAAVASGSERLNRFLARRGVASRRSADDLIAAGRVRVNGRTAQVGDKVDSNTASVEVDGARVTAQLPAAVTLALNKPAGVVTTMRDPRGRPTVRDLVPQISGLVPIGRLDADSRGLLLLSSDGELAHRIAHPRHGVHKTYRVTPTSSLSDAQIREMLGGVMLDDGPAHALEVRRAGRNAVDVVMGEGRKRVVRRLFAAVGNGVVDLCRTAVGPITLGDLADGASRSLDAAEVDMLHDAVRPPGAVRR
jgi:23S rRNA pseudouridine2605 synthase